MADAEPPFVEPGHVFVIHGDVLSLSADALLVPTRNLQNRNWFPDGPPAGAVQPARDAFTPEDRVLPVDNGAVWLGHLDGRFAPSDRMIVGTDRPELAWYLEAAVQFVTRAHAELAARQTAPLGGRAKHVLAMPVIGTGKGGARAKSGEMIRELLLLLDHHARMLGVDVALVAKNDRMFSAAQAHRLQLSINWEAKLGPRLNAAASQLARLAASERLALFLGAGVSVGAGLPEWSELVQKLASRPEVDLDEAEMAQLLRLGLPDQAAVVASRLGRSAAAASAPAASAPAASAPAASASSGLSDVSDASEWSGDEPLASLVVGELSSRRYSITHGLLAGLPVQAVVTTNYDALFETAWRAADKQFNVLPYETQPPSDRFILKLHGDLSQPRDIVLTRSQMLDSREQRKALSGIVQTMLLTKHLLFVGFSLQDPNFSEVAGTVRRARAAGSSSSRSSSSGNDDDFGGGDLGAVGGETVVTATDRADTDSAHGGDASGTLLTLHNRPFLAELWPELSCVPMDLKDTTEANRVPRPQCARLMEMVLDKVSLDSSTTTRHLLDEDFSGAFSEAETALKARLQTFKQRLSRNGLARQSSGFAVVDQMLRRLGDTGRYEDRAAGEL